MFNKKFIEEDFFEEIFDGVDLTIMSRLQKTLENRLKMYNMFKSLLNRHHIPLTVKNLNIDINDKNQITNFMEKNTIEIGLLSEFVKDYFHKYGTEWQKNRLLNISKNKG